MDADGVLLNSYKISSLQQRHTELRSALKKESQFSWKVELNMQIKKINIQTETQKSKL